MLRVGGFENQFFDSHQTCILTTNIQRDGTQHECDANFTNGLDKESVMHFDKKML